MKTKIIGVIGLLLYFLSQTTAFAESGWFIGGGGGLVSFDDEVDIVDTGNLFVRGGYSLNDYIDLGADISFTLITDDINDVDHDLAVTFVYIKGNVPVSDDSKLYLMFGATRVKLTESIRRSSDEFEDDGNGVGFGIQLDSRDGGFYTVEYLQYYDDEFDNINADVSSRGINFGFIQYF